MVRCCRISCLVDAVLEGSRVGKVRHPGHIPRHSWDQLISAPLMVAELQLTQDGRSMVYCNVSGYGSKI